MVNFKDFLRQEVDSLMPERWVVPYTDRFTKTNKFAILAVPFLRLIFGLYLAFVSVYTLVGPGWIDRGNAYTGKYWFYYTNWSAIAVSAYFLTMAYYNFRHAMSRLENLSASAVSPYAAQVFKAKSKWSHLMLHYIYSITFPGTIIVVLTFYLLLPANAAAAANGPDYWASLSKHGIQLGFMLFDAIFLNQINVHVSHVVAHFAHIILYMFWSWIGNAVIQQDDGVSWWPYGFLDLTRGNAYIWYLALIAIYVTMYFVSFGIHKLRDFIRSKLFTEEEGEEEPMQLENVYSSEQQLANV